MLSGTAVLLGLGIHKYQDQIQEVSSQVFDWLGLHLGEAKDKILVFLDDLKEKVMSLPLASSSTADDQDTGASTSGTSTRSIVDRIKDFVPYLGNTETESGEF